MHFQTTICSPVSCYGIGVHSGQKTQLTLKPAKSDTGVVFIRTDVTDIDNKIYASYQNVFDTSLSTSIKNNANVTISTIEHLMAAIWGCGLDNVIIEVDGPEVPIMDGSSQPFVFMIEYAGMRELTIKRKYLKLIKEVVISDQGSEIYVTPSNEAHIDLVIDFESKPIGRQKHIFTHEHNFKDEIANARTFGFVKDLDYLRSKGLAKGASLDNAIGIENNAVLNPEGLRHKNEFARHKLLDLVGDLFTSGGGVIAKIQAYKPSHNINNKLLRKIFSDPYSYKWVSMK